MVWFDVARLLYSMVDYDYFTVCQQLGNLSEHAPD
jgi:hypothetical protein